MFYQMLLIYYQIWGVSDFYLHIFSLCVSLLPFEIQIKHYVGLLDIIGFRGSVFFSLVFFSAL